MNTSNSSGLVLLSAAETLVSMLLLQMPYKLGIVSSVEPAIAECALHEAFGRVDRAQMTLESVRIGEALVTVIAIQHLTLAVNPTLENIMVGKCL